MDVSETKSLALTMASRTRHYGPDDPRTIAAARELLAAKVRAAEAEAARLRAQLDVMPDPGRELAAAGLAAAVRAATAAGLDSADLAAVVSTGQLPAEVTAA